MEMILINRRKFINKKKHWTKIMTCICDVKHSLCDLNLLSIYLADIYVENKIFLRVYKVSPSLFSIN